jgi:hypothetical protein
MLHDNFPSTFWSELGAVLTFVSQRRLLLQRPSAALHCNLRNALSILLLGLYFCGGGRWNIAVGSQRQQTWQRRPSGGVVRG